MTRALLVVLVALIVTVAALYARYFVFFEPEDYLSELSRNKLRELSREPNAPWPPPDAASRFHKGAGSCLRYARTDGPGNSSAEEKALDELQAAALLEGLEDVRILLRHWSDEDERARHGPVSDEELLLPSTVKPSFEDRVAVAVHAGKVAALQRAKGEREQAEVARKAEEQSARLSSMSRDVLENIWSRHPEALAPQGRIFAGSLWKVRVTRIRLERIRAAIETFHGTYKKCPAALDDIDEKVAKTSLVDGFGRAFDYQKKESGCRIFSLGLDGYPGGFGPSADQETTVGLAAP